MTARVAPILLVALLAGCPDPPYEPTCADAPAGDPIVAAPTWSEHVAPIVGRKCLGCHTDGGVGPMDLSTYASAAEWATPIQYAVESDRMPPFGPTNCGECNTWREARSLTPGEKATLLAWTASGAPEGPVAEPPEPPSPVALDREDLVLQLAEAYTPDRALADDYRCFVIDPGLAEDAVLTGFEVRPGDAEIVHHVILYAASDEDADAALREKDAEDATPGYPCFGGAGVGGTSVAALWAPGVGATKFPDQTGLRLGAGRLLSMQIHYHPVPSEDRTDRSSIALQLEAEVAQEAFISGIADHDFVLEGGQSEARAIVDQDSLVPGGGEVNVWGVIPHMHQLGRSIRVDALSPAGDACLVDVPRWDFNWQGLYFYEQPVTLGGGTRLRLDCRWDTRGVDGPVTWGDGTEDEMCIAFFYVTWEGFTAP